MENIVKKLISLWLCATLLLGLGACGSTSEQTDNNIADEETGTTATQEAINETAEDEDAIDGTTEDSASGGKSMELYVSAAASLTDAVTELNQIFNEVHPEVELVVNYGSSGKLQQQIEEGAPADVFVSAGQKQMNALEEQNLVDTDSRIDLLENKVVLIQPATAEHELASFEDVLNDDIKMIAIGESSVPVGQYTEAIFTNLGIWDQVQTKANFGQDVRNVLAWVETGDADCGVVYATDAAISDKVKVVTFAPEGSHDPVIYPAAVMAGSDQPDMAKAYLNFLTSPEASAVFERYGFDPVN
ncbi:MAG: molybdate ABC transporter substrate-binding protein [Fastidiosipilaceae bacterium]|jgi:molybdate transport system substrate-binding protein|nr:molybdate ABC transporter substrate-binding protein [Clostridiaceae bacterium]